MPITGDPPGPSGARNVDELSARLRALQAWAGVPYREVHRRVVRDRRHRGVVEVPSYNTVYRCLQPGRSRLDRELVADIARVLLGDDELVVEWRQAYQVVTGRAIDASLVTVSDVLPAAPPDFTGREPELTVLEDAVDDGAAVIGIEGMAGVGKTALARVLAHRVAERTDLQLAVDLRGYDPGRPPADPGAVLDGFLRRLGVPGAQIHGLDLSARITRYRRLLTGRKALLVLDNAASPEQVRPLLPGTPDCVTVVTTRHRLDLPGAVTVRLGVLSQDEAVTMLRRSAGPVVTHADAHRIAELTGRLPLALSLVGGRIRATPDWSLADHVERLGERRRNLRLDSDVELALISSYDVQPDELRRTLRLLGLIPVRVFDSHAAAALTGTTVAVMRDILDGLTAASLIERRMPDRYELHDLVRIFATGRAQDEEAPAARRTALTRLFDHYRAAAGAAIDVYVPHERYRRPDLGTPASELPEFADADAARSWLDLERTNLLAVAAYCGQHGWPEHTGHLSILLFRYLDIAGRYQDSLALHALAGRVAEPPLSGRALYYLSIARIALGEYDEARRVLREARRIVAAAGDRVSEAGTLTTIAGVHWRTGRYEDAITAFDEALALARGTGDPSVATHSLASIGIISYLLGRYDEALRVCTESLEIARGIDDTVGVAGTLTVIGGIHERLGNLDRAEQVIDEALETVRRIGYRLGEADALNHLGALRLAQGRLDEALELHPRALELARADGVPVLEVQIRNGYGRALRAAGSLGSAVRCFRQALRIATVIDDRYEQGRAHDGLGTTLAAAGRKPAAAEHLRRALARFTELGTPEAAAVSSALDRL